MLWTLYEREIKLEQAHGEERRVLGAEIRGERDEMMEEEEADEAGESRENSDLEFIYLNIN